MPYISEMTMYPNAPTSELLKQWITELTNYSPQQVNTVISQIEYGKTPQITQCKLTSRQS